MHWMVTPASTLQTLADASLVVCMPMRNMAPTVARSVESVLSQQGMRGRLVLLVADDASTDGSLHVLGQLARRERVVITRGRFGSAWAARNFLLRVVERYARRCTLILRLDADDVMEERGVIRTVEKSFRRSASFRYGFRRPPVHALLAGNSLEFQGRQLERLNLPSERLLRTSGLLEQLAGMAAGEPLAELPSCNLVLRPGRWRYPSVVSAEDHWLTARTLLASGVRIEEELIYCRYSLSGAVTRTNRAGQQHRQARVKLFRTVAAHLYGSRHG